MKSPSRVILDSGRVDVVEQAIDSEVPPLSILLG